MAGDHVVLNVTDDGIGIYPEDMERIFELFHIKKQWKKRDRIRQGCGGEAVEYMKENSSDLILIDMIIYLGINGRENYERIIQFHPYRKAIVASGFSETDNLKVRSRIRSKPIYQKALSFRKNRNSC